MCVKKVLPVAALCVAFCFSALAQQSSAAKPQPERPSYLPPLSDLQKAPDPPKPGFRHRVFDKKFLLVTAVSVGVSIAATRSLTRCRADHGIGPCTDGGYGEFKAREVLRQGLTGFFILPSYKVKSIEDNQGCKHKFWWVFPVVAIGMNAGVMVQNQSKHYGPKVD